MANKPVAEREARREKVLCETAKLFLEQGYANSTVKDIAKNAGIPVATLYRIFGDKESILCELVKFVLSSQFNKAKKAIAGITEDKILYYAVETTLQLYMTESHEHIRELYSTAYSLPETTEIIQNTITGKIENVFAEHLPNLTTADFYKKEIASGGVMRGFMTIPCDMWFTMDQKVGAFLENTLLIYEVPKEKIAEAIEFVLRFDFPKMAKELIEEMLDYLDGKVEEMEAE